MKNLSISFIVIVLFFCSCSNSPITKLSETQKASIAAEVEGLYRSTISNLSKLDIVVWSEPWRKGEMISVSSGINYFDTYKEFKDSVTYWFSLCESQQVEVVQANATVFSDELVLITSITNWDIKLKNGEEMNVYPIATLLWKKVKNGWKIIYLHESWQ